uniref:Reeler domain containing 1 n=1 Tax=Salarias fasciatus TaxID=181472 RepID=A0A672JCX3_SALFA
MIFLLHWFYVGVALLSLAPPPTASFSRGASPASCRGMTPNHIRAHPQDSRQGYVTVHTSASSYLPGQLVTVTVRSSRDFMGFLLQARSVGDPVLLGGSWALTPPGAHTLHCLSEDDTVTHSDKQLKRNLSFVWRAPDTPIGDVRFYITVVQSYFVYWAGIKSAVFSHQVSPDTSTTQTEVKVTVTQRDQFQSEKLPETSRTFPQPWTKPLSSETPEGEGEDDLMLQTSSETASLAAASSSSSSTNVNSSPSSKSTSSSVDPTVSSMVSRHPTILKQSSSSTTNQPDTATALFKLTTLSLIDVPVQQPSVQNSQPSSASTIQPSVQNSQPSLASSPTTSRPAVHLNPKPHPNLKLNPGHEAKPNRPNSKTKPPAETPEKEGKYPEIVPRHSDWELGMLLGCSAGLGMALVVAVRYVYRKACGKQTQVTLNDREREYPRGDRGLIHVQECGDLVRVRKFRENSFVLLAEYDILATPTD